MSDQKIYNINDYRKNDSGDDDRLYSASDADQVEKKDLSKTDDLWITAAIHSNVDVNQIEIEDPLDFLNTDERERYMKVQQKKQAEEIAQVKARLAADEKGQSPSAKRESYIDFRDEEGGEDISPEDMPQELPKSREERRREQQDRKRSSQNDYDQYDDYDEEEDEEDYDEEYDPDEDSDGGLQKITKIVSILVGAVVVLLAVVLIKTQLVDPYLAGHETADEDEFGTEETTEGTTVVTTHDLRLRTAPDTSDDSNIYATVKAGTTLTKVGEESGWTVVEYEGQKLYCSSQYVE